MTKEEAETLVSKGYAGSVVSSLHERGWEPAGVDPEDRQTMQFLRRSCLPHHLISLPADADLADLDDVIFDAGRLAQQKHIQARHASYLRSIRVLETLPGYDLKDYDPLG